MAYSQDLRERVVRAVERGDRSQTEVAEEYGVSRSFVEEVWRRYRETGSCAIKVWHHGPRAKLAASRDYLGVAVGVVRVATDAPLPELGGHLPSWSMAIRLGPLADGEQGTQVDLEPVEPERECRHLSPSKKGERVVSAGRTRACRGSNSRCGPRPRTSSWC